MAESELTGLDNGTKGSRCVESGDTSSPSATPFRKRALRCKFELKLAGQVHLLEHLVLANIGRNHLLDLLALEQETEASANNTSIIRDSCQTSDRRVLLDRIYESIRHTGETKSTTQKGAVGLHVFDGFLRGWEDLVNFIAAEGRAEVAREIEVYLQVSIGDLISLESATTFVLLREKVRAVRSVKATDGIVLEAQEAL